MRIKRPHVASLEQVVINREGEDAVIVYVDSTFATTHLHIGPQVQQMADKEILDLHNDVIRAQQRLKDENLYTAIEIPVGHPQIKYFEQGDQLVPRGHVLRCIIDDGGPNSEITVWIDDRELSLEEFGRLLSTYAGWGMRITFVPDEDILEHPPIEIRDCVDDD